MPTQLLEKERGLRWVLVDGMLAGSWGIDRTKTSARLRVHAFGRWTKAEQRAVADEGAAFLAFVAADVDGHDVEVITV